MFEMWAMEQDSRISSAHKAVGIILNSKSYYFINAFDMVLSVGCILCTAGSENRCIECPLRAMRLLSWLVLVGAQVRQPLNLGSILNSKSDHFINAFGMKPLC
ncbi:MAG: hypothetical protein ACJAZP_003249 [Psychromonas sp.]|jgi:hypothetical protein